jgi:hypothetical protein
MKKYSEKNLRITGMFYFFRKTKNRSDSGGLNDFIGFQPLFLGIPIYRLFLIPEIPVLRMWCTRHQKIKV